LRSYVCGCDVDFSFRFLAFEILLLKLFLFFKKKKEGGSLFNIFHQKCIFVFSDTLILIVSISLCCWSYVTVGQIKCPADLWCHTSQLPTGHHKRSTTTVKPKTL
jgi:hypothetical protein